MQNGTIIDKRGKYNHPPMKYLLLFVTVAMLFSLPSKSNAQAGTCAPGKKCYAYGGHPQYSKPGPEKNQQKTGKRWVGGHFSAGKKGKKQWTPGHWEGKK
jgi:hypothetical protein